MKGILRTRRTYHVVAQTVSTFWGALAREQTERKCVYLVDRRLHVNEHNLSARRVTSSCICSGKARPNVMDKVVFVLCVLLCDCRPCIARPIPCLGAVFC